MSNKKWFWIVFFTLSCCEFGQFAYSKNVSVSVSQVKPSNNILNCHAKQTLVSELLFNGRSASYLLPR
jgi:hypothetical protein